MWFKSASSGVVVLLLLVFSTLNLGELLAFYGGSP